MAWIALIDATRHAPEAGPERVVAGLTLLERAVRLAKVSGATRGTILALNEHAETVQTLISRIDFGIKLELLRVEPAPLAAYFLNVAHRLDDGPDQLEFQGDRGGLGELEGFLYLRSSTVYDRGLIHADPRAKTPNHEILMVPGTMLGAQHGQKNVDLSDLGDILEISASKWPEFIEICAEVVDKNSLTSARGDSAGADPLFAELIETAQIDIVPTDKWQVRVTDAKSAREAADRLWAGCRKPVDGVISRHLNRYISLAISRSIAASGIHPNHISIVTFSLGIIAALLAAQGGYVYFVLAGLAYQANSVVDGVDGELARVKYEFSLLGEWLDTLSDDLKDVLFYAGLGIGAWRTAPFPGGLDPSIWLWLGGVAVAGKLVSMVAYYSWLIAHKRGDLLAFEWSFENREESEETALSRLLSMLKYATKNDFIVFVAMLMAFVAALPYFLFIVAPGQFVVATSVIMQRIQGSKA